tara:strand:+ start:1018 stop:1677 length:660 start_codon:yes stop_codon:yes gene_type:complete
MNDYLYTKDEYEKNLLLDKDTGYQVMMEWEKEYMQDLIKKLNPFGDVLEIGFGLGISANFIQKYNIKTHTIIECNPTVIQKLKKWAKKQKHKVIIIEDKWQNVLSSLGYFDTIFFDDTPETNSLEGDLFDTRVYDFFHIISNNNVKKGTRFNWFMCNDIYWLVNPFIKWDVDMKKYNVPDNCNYLKKSTLFIPLIEFKKSNLQVKKFILNNLLQLSVKK